MKGCELNGQSHKQGRCEKEVQIIQEEMRQTIVYYEWKEQWWLQIARQATCDDSIQHGITAYSQKQADYCKCLAESFAMAWLPFLQSEGIKPEWEQRYEQLIQSAKNSREKETSGDESEEGEIEEEPEERYDAFELDD